MRSGWPVPSYSTSAHEMVFAAPQPTAAAASAATAPQIPDAPIARRALVGTPQRGGLVRRDGGGENRTPTPFRAPSSVFCRSISADLGRSGHSSTLRTILRAARPCHLGWSGCPRVALGATLWRERPGYRSFGTLETGVPGEAAARSTTATAQTASTGTNRMRSSEAARGRDRPISIGTEQRCGDQNGRRRMCGSGS
jgi:hypothetical protein